MLELVHRLKSAHICYRCRHKIKKGESAMVVLHYADKNMYRHTSDCTGVRK